MEKTDKCVVVPSDFGWSDIGSWKSLYDFLEKDTDCNVIEGDVIARDTRNCFIQGHDRLIATNRLQEIVVVETPDSIFVSDLEHSRDVKSIVTELKNRGRKEYQQHRTVYHPWGISKLLEQSQHYMAAELTVYPDSSLEIPYDENRIQHLMVIRGDVTVKSASRDKTLSAGETFTCCAEDEVRIRNKGENEAYVVQVALTRS
jgi:mannose-6-phosphate isomerase-like protein (cupin superfamily)